MGLTSLRSGRGDRLGTRQQLTQASWTTAGQAHRRIVRTAVVCFHGAARDPCFRHSASSRYACCYPHQPMPSQPTPGPHPSNPRVKLRQPITPSRPEKPHPPHTRPPRKTAPQTQAQGPRAKPPPVQSEPTSPPPSAPQGPSVQQPQPRKPSQPGKTRPESAPSPSPRQKALEPSAAWVKASPPRPTRALQPSRCPSHSRQREELCSRP